MRLLLLTLLFLHLADAFLRWNPVDFSTLNDQNEGEFLTGLISDDHDDHGKGGKATTPKYKEGHHSHSDSSDSRESHKQSTRRSTPRPTLSSKVPSSRSTILPSTTSSLPPSTTSTTSSTTSDQACAQSVFPTTAPFSDVGFVYNPDIVFQVFQNESGCDLLKITCSGYFSVYIAAQWTNGNEVIFPEPVDAPDNSTLVITSTTLAWEQYGWGANTPEKIIKDNSFYCMVGSLLPNGKEADGPSCECKYESVWIDLMIIIDSTNSMENPGLQEIFASIQTTLSWFNIQNTSSTDLFHTRIGIILYNSASTLYAPLGSLNLDQLEKIESLPFLGGASPRIDYAILMAMQQFDSAGRRPNARKVIALFATSFNPLRDAAQTRADSFKEDDGVLFVYNFVQKNAVPTPSLATLASNGYFFDTTTDKNGEAFKKSLCTANCFCRDEYSSYKNNEENGTPMAGCYKESDTPANFLFASQRCLQSKGYLAQPKTAEKTQFLQNQFEDPNRQFYIGVVWNATLNGYFWLDGSSVNDTIRSHPDGQDCVAVINGIWTPVVCKTGYYSVCEAVPCDSTNYCYDEE